MEIYVDESGDLGFDLSLPRTTRYFSITAIVPTNPPEFQHLTAKFIKKIRRRNKIPKSQKLHAYDATDRVYEAVLKKVADTGVKIHTIILNKERVYSRLHGKKEIFYNFLSGILLVPLLMEYEDVTLIVDQKNREYVEGLGFNEYIETKLLEVLVDEDMIQKVDRINLSIRHLDDEVTPALQVTDFVSNCIFPSYERQDYKFYSIIDRCIENKIEYLF